MSWSRLRVRGNIKASALHGTLCHCRKEAKQVWQTVGPACWARLTPDLRLKVVNLKYNPAPSEERNAIIREVFAFLDSQPLNASTSQPSL